MFLPRLGCVFLIWMWPFGVDAVVLKWSRLNVGLVRFSTAPAFPPRVMQGLDEAINSLNKLIHVRMDDEDLMEIARDRILKCTKNDDFLGDHVFVERFVRKHTVRRTKISGNGIELKKTGLNFALFLLADADVCKKDPFMLAGAAPCMDPNGRLETVVPRPICGKLIVCLKNPAWKSFSSSYDLFRHEILHALGFGTIIPDKYGNSTKPEVKFLNNNVDRQPQRYTSHFMDFAGKATVAAQKYFKCEELTGIEAEDAQKTHLSEYVYGNELMTPVVSNGPNYFTYLSALILEETHLGQIPWYRTNKTNVKRESNGYWYGRSWGCTFALKSCYEFIKEAQNTRRDTAFPFCSEADLRDFLWTRKPLRVCFSDGAQTKVVHTTCNLMKKLVQPAGQFKPMPLLSQYPRLRQLLDSIGYPVYGSDSFHHYCPMIRELVEDELRHLPSKAEIVPCP